MKKSLLSLQDKSIPLYTCNTVVVGSGAAGFNAADMLHSFGQEDIVLVTEGVNTGTSRNTGSDKQTYYKLTLSGSGADSVHAMAKTLFDGGCMDGDIALAEAAMSVRCFLRLVELGVPFPTNAYGEYIGYKTDHDPLARATSAGPLTSRLMTEALERSVYKKGITVLNRLLAVSILTENGEVGGLLCLDLSSPGDFVLFCCKNIIWAVGGPAGIYSDSVYPRGHYGASGVALEAGACGRNLTEWQYGLASVAPRWNVSGTYMQSLPRFVSTGPDGGEEQEFLTRYFQNPGDMLTRIFLKGYEWPFDVRKAVNGSSVIDLLVYAETMRGRKVYLDYRSNPGKSALDFSLLSEEASDYLGKAGALFGNPIDRLIHMNAPAYEFYKSRGVDLADKPLEIALCAQHNNGGLATDMWWQTNVSGLFAAGEAAGTHGVYRPGGSALNSGQAGSARAALYISMNRRGEPKSLGNCCLKRASGFLRMAENAVGGDTVTCMRDNARRRMSRCAAAIRGKDSLSACLTETDKELANFETLAKVASASELDVFFRLRDMLVTQSSYLSAMLDYIEKGGKSRGSAMYTNVSGDDLIRQLASASCFSLDSGDLSGQVQEVEYRPGGCCCIWRAVRPIPGDNGFFENIWRDFRKDGNVRYL